MTRTIDTSKSVSMDVPGVFFIDKEAEPACPICLEIIGNEKDSAVLACGHKYHSSCLFASAVNGNNNCALCRVQVGTKPESRPKLTRPLASIFVQNEFNQIGLGRVMTNFCKNIGPKALAEWRSMSSEERLESCDQIISIFAQFGVRINRQISNWINEGDERLNIPEEAQIEPFTIPLWSFTDSYACNHDENEGNEGDEEDNDDNSFGGEYDDMPPLVDEEDNIWPYHFRPDAVSSVITAQRMIRGFIARQNYNSSYMRMERYKLWIHQLEIWGCAIHQTTMTIQKTWRSYLIRNRFNIARNIGNIYYPRVMNVLEGADRFLMVSGFQLFVRGDISYDEYSIRCSDSIFNQNNITDVSSIQQLDDSLLEHQIETDSIFNQNNITDVSSTQQLEASFFEHRIKIQKGCLKIQAVWRGYRERKIIQLDNNIIIPPISEISNNDEILDMSWDDPVADLNSLFNFENFIETSSLPESIVERLSNNEHLSNYNYLMSLEIDDIIWPPGGSGIRPLFTREEANQIFGEIIRHIANYGWSEIYEQLD